MAWDKSKPLNGDKLKDFPAIARANWQAIEDGTDSALLITNAKISPTAGIVDTKLAQITTAAKVSGAAITLLGSVPSGAGQLPIANGGTGSATKNFVDLTTDQTVAGIKSFSVFPVTPSGAPSADYQVANKKYIDDLIAAIQTEEPGVIKEWGGLISTIPSPYFFCNGAAKSRSTESALFAAIGTIHGIGDGSTTFNLPDRRDKFPIGAKQDDSGKPKSNITGSLLQSGGPSGQPPIVTTSNSGTGEAHSSGPNQSAGNHSHTVDITPPFYSAVFMIKK